MNILQVNLLESAGGAARIAYSLLQKYRQRGHVSNLAVGCKASNDHNIYEFPNNAYRNPWARVWCMVEAKSINGHIRFLPRIANFLASFGEPRRSLEVRRGVEDFNFPGTSTLLDLPAERPDILHLHNLHTGYFDLRALPDLSNSIPTMLTLHDEWTMTGHCACTLGCERWQIGCGHCPDLDVYPAVPRDATAYNFSRKRDIYKKCRLYISAPSKWLLDRVRRSVLQPAIIESRVIPNGVDLSVFHPEDKQAARHALGLPQHAWIGLCVGDQMRNNVFKDYTTIEGALAQFANQPSKSEQILLCLGEGGNDQKIGPTSIRFVPYQNDLAKVAQYYHASDVYLHAAHADTFPNSILEALACGIPVVATAVGGIPEQIVDGFTGFLVPPGDSKAMAMCVKQLQENAAMKRRISAQAADYSVMHFGINRMVDDYLEWYEEMMKSHRY